MTFFYIIFCNRMDMKITQLIKSLKEQGYGRSKHQHIEVQVKQQIHQAWTEKIKPMSKRQFARYLEPLWFGRSTLKKILKEWENIWVWATDAKKWEARKKENYGNRYVKIDRTKKIEYCSQEQKNYVIKLRIDEPNMWYKRFYNNLLIPEEIEKYKGIFWTDSIISNRLFYDIIHEAKLPHRIYKRQKQSMIQKLKKDGTFDKYCKKMGCIYLSYRALHRRQVDIKYLTDIPNIVELGLWNIYPYQITFRDFRSWATLVFLWGNRDTSRVMMATMIFEKILIQTWIDTKNVILQFDWWAEFSTYKMTWNIGEYLKYVDVHFKWHAIIDRKEQNWHVEAYHRICEDDLFDTAKIKNLKWRLSKDNKSELLKVVHDYVLRHNKYRYSSYAPRYKIFKKKSPLQIIKEDRGDKINIHILETYLGAYDVDCWFRMKDKVGYPLLINSLISYKLEHPARLFSGHFWVKWYTFWIFLYNHTILVCSYF